MTLGHRIRFYQQLAVLARAGVSIRTSLQRMEKRLAGPEVRALAQQVEQGNTLGEAFTAAGFSPFECHLVAAGERSAQLDVVFERLGEFWNRERHFIQALVRQLYYPAFVAHLVVVVSGLLLLTQGTAAVVRSIVVGLVTLYVIAFALYVLIRVSWHSEIAQRFWLFIPLIGGALKAAHAYRWITALRMEFIAGVPFPDAVADAWRASGYLNAETHALEGQHGMRSGTDLSLLVEGWRQLPRDWIDFFETAQASGQFEATFTQLEAEAAHNWATTQARMSEWVPKILVIVFIFLVAYKIFTMSQAVDSQTEQIEKVIDDATR